MRRNRAIEFYVKKFARFCIDIPARRDIIILQYFDKEIEYGTQKGRLLWFKLSRQRNSCYYPRNFVDMRFRNQVYGGQNSCRSYPSDFRLEHHLDSRPHLHDNQQAHFPHYTHIIGKQ